jgi:hypothetical protein
LATAFPAGRGGILYLPEALSCEVTDEAAFLQLCPQADDVWLYWMGRRVGSTYRKVQHTEGLWDWPGPQKTALFRENLPAQERPADRCGRATLWISRLLAYRRMRTI